MPYIEVSCSMQLQAQWFGDAPAKVAGSCECGGLKEFDESTVGCELGARWWLRSALVASGAVVAVALLLTIVVKKFTYKYGSGVCERIVVLPN